MLEDHQATRDTESSIGALVRCARRRRFVGRTDELARVARGVAGEAGLAPVLVVHGVGGTGKTALLERLAHESEAAGRRVVRGDAASLEPARDLPAAGDPRPWTILIDALDECPGFEERLREDVLPGLPAATVVVCAGRDRPGPGWTADPGWRELVEVRELGPLTDDEARRLLRDAGVPRRHERAVLRFAAGNPLALTLAAEATRHGTDGEGLEDADWAPDRRLVGTLLEQVVGTPPDPRHDLALRVAAHSAHTTVDLLRGVLVELGIDAAEAEAAAAESFAWLRDLPVMTVDGLGLRAHALVRRLVDSDHRWRDPAGYDAVHRAIWHHLGERVVHGEGDAARTLAADLVHLRRYAHPEPPCAAETAPAPLPLEVGEDHAETVRALATAHLGLAEQRVVEAVLARRPAAFTCYARSRTGPPAGFLGLLVADGPDALAELRALTEVEGEPDPVVAAVAEDLGGRAREDQQLLVARFVVPRPRAAHLATADPRLGQVYAEVLTRASRLAASYVVLADPDPCVDFLHGWDHRWAARVGRDDDELGVFAHHWDEVPLGAHLERVRPPAVPVTPDASGTRPLWTREDFDDAVRRALRDWCDAGAFGAGPLVRAGFASHRDPEDPAAAVREAVAEAVARLGDDPRHTKAHRAVSETFLHRPVTQEAAASRAGMPFSTYRRHLAKGIDLVCDRLWSQAQAVPSVGV